MSQVTLVTPDTHLLPVVFACSPIALSTEREACGEGWPWNHRRVITSRITRLVRRRNQAATSPRDPVGSARMWRRRALACHIRPARLCLASPHCLSCVSGRYLMDGTCWSGAWEMVPEWLDMMDGPRRSVPASPYWVSCTVSYIEVDGLYG